MELRDKSDNEVVARTERTAVFLDMLTGKTSSIPQDKRNFFQTFITSEKPTRVNIPVPPSEPFTMKLNVTASDTDHLYHMNQAVWLRFCIDCATEGVSRGHLANFNQDPFSHAVKQVEILYDSEALAGDILDVACWDTESLDKEKTLVFSVTHNGKSCVRCFVKYYNSIQ